MAYTLFSEDVENLSHLSDLPNEEDNLTAAQLKAVFDKAGVDIKAFLNGTHIPELSKSSGKSFTVTFPSGETTYNFTSTSYNLSSSTDVFCMPAASSQALWNKHGVKCSSVTTNKLTFTANTAPSSNVSINVFVMN